MKKILLPALCCFFTAFLIGTTIFSSGTIFAQSAEKPLVGAIRWDAWYGNVPANVKLTDPRSWPGAKPNLTASPDPGAETLRSLSPERWAWRRPFFARHDDQGKLLEINGNRQEIMDQEIDYAAHAGLDYWAFATYPEDCPLSWCFKKYIASAKKAKVKFCFFLVLGSNYGNFSEDPKMQDYVLRYITDPDYLKVQGNRPVLYLGFFNKKIDEIFLSGFWDKYCARIKALGLGKPYVILARGTKVPPAKAFLQKLGADALSNYAVNIHKAEKADYSQLAQKAEQFAIDCKKNEVNVAPICVLGWDHRPRLMNHVSWEHWYDKETMDNFVKAGSPSELAAHIGRNLDWLKKNPNSDGVNLMLIYAWNECDEGGWLIPSLPEPRGQGTQRIDALRKVLRP